MYVHYDNSCLHLLSARTTHMYIVTTHNQLLCELFFFIQNDLKVTHFTSPQLLNKKRANVQIFSPTVLDCPILRAPEIHNYNFINYHPKQPP